MTIYTLFLPIFSSFLSSFHPTHFVEHLGTHFVEHLGTHFVEHLGTHFGKVDKYSVKYVTHVNHCARHCKVLFYKSFSFCYSFSRKVRKVIRNTALNLDAGLNKMMRQCARIRQSMSVSH